MRSSRRACLQVVVAGVVAASVPPVLASDALATVSSRGQTIRVLVDKPAGTPLGSVVLLTGGPGRLDITADGKLGTGAGNQLVRTRGGYAKAGFVTVVPDLAPDQKTADGVKAGSRWSSEQAQDMSAVVKFARTLAAPVHLVATSRGSLPAAKVGASVKSGEGRPDSLVITAGMLVDVDAKQPSVQSKVPGLGGITQPVFLLHHKNDGCAYTPASAPARFKPLLTGSKRVDIQIVEGGSAGKGDPCQAQSHHGFLGQDDLVVKLITDWLKAAK